MIDGGGRGKIDAVIGTGLEGRYRIVRRLGAGATGEVFLAEHLALGRLEALKILRPEMLHTPKLVARFRREARAINRLQHPNIVTVLDFGQIPDGRFYLTMEYADGEPLDALLQREGALPLPRALHIMVQLVDAMAHAHSRGVIHRDLKPSNLYLVEHRGRHDVVKVLDFGIAKITASDYEDSVGHTDSGGVYGTPAYMAPELVRGGRPDHRIDQYAMGCIAFELVTGRTPFRGRAMTVMHKHATATPEPPSAITDTLPPEFDDIVARCLAKDPDDRFQDASELSAALKEVAGYRPEPSAGRHTLRSMRATVEPPSHAAVDAWSEKTDVDPNPHGFATSPTLAAGEPPAQALLEQRRTLRALAEALSDADCDSIDLVFALGDMVQADDLVAHLQEELDDLDNLCDIAEQRARESEAALRFTVAELRFRGAEQATGASRLAELEQRLAAIPRSLSDELERMNARSVELTARLAEAEARLEQTCETLAALVSELLPAHADDPAVAAAADRADAARVQYELTRMADE